MKRKPIATVFICLMMFGILTGCGQAGDTADITGEITTEETTEEEDKPAEEVVENKKPDKEENEAEFDTTAAEKSLKEMSEALSGFLWASMMKEAQYSPLEAGDINLELTDEEKIRAAVLACEPDGVIDSTFVLGMGGFSEDRNAESGPGGDGFHGVSVSEKDVDETCLDLFGTKADWGELPPGPMCDLYDAVLYRTENDSCALIIDKEEETETDFKNQECTVIEENGKYTGKVNVFWGYWGELEQKPGYSNYVAIYELEPNDESKYGMVIKSISINRTDDDSYEQSADAGEGEDTGKTGLSAAADGKFYGVFIKAFNEEKDSDNTLSALEEAGFVNCPVVYTPNFEELNPEPYYVVTAGLFTTEEAANEALDKAKAGGFPDAYVKYAGSYTGDTVWYYMYGTNGIEILKDGIFLHDVEVTIPYRTDGQPMKTDLFVSEDTVFDKNGNTDSFAYYKKGDTPYKWIVRNYNLINDDPEEYGVIPILTGVFEVSVDGDIVKAYHRSFWWD